MEVEGIESIKSLIGAGLGASILPLCALGEHPRSAELRVVRVKGKPLVRELGLAALDAVILPNAIRELAAALLAALGGKERRRP
jgi:DNA-binding transcriptional LysR family regulator